MRFIEAMTYSQTISLADARHAAEHGRITNIGPVFSTLRLACRMRLDEPGEWHMLLDEISGSTSVPRRPRVGVKYGRGKAKVLAAFATFSRMSAAAAASDLHPGYVAAVVHQLQRDGFLIERRRKGRIQELRIRRPNEAAA